MSHGMPVGQAREQLEELISILRELRNAGPRDQSFKQWRQVTLTLLQRIWPGEPARAAIFRRILFSAPTARADAAATREYYERGCSEASAYLEGLAIELETGVALKTPPSAPPPAAEAPAPRPEAGPGPLGSHDTAAPARPLKFRPTRPAEVVRPSPPADIIPAAPFTMPSASAPAPGPLPEVAPPAPPRPPAAAPAPPAAKSGARPKARLKDMLGFGDEPTPARPAPALPPPPAAAAPAPLPVPPVASAPASPPVSAPAPAEAAPISRPPLTVTPRPTPAPVEPDESEPEFELEEVLFQTQAGGAIPEAAADDRPGAGRPAPTLAAREVLSMAGLVAELGVPAQRRAIVRAALIDLGRQMDSPPVHWAAIRQALAFMLDYPQIARRVLPLLMPYLEEAA